MLFVNGLNVYLTSRLVEDRADTYGALGTATALLFSLYIVGRVIVGSAVLNATLDARRQGLQKEGGRRGSRLQQSDSRRTRARFDVRPVHRLIGPASGWPCSIH